MLSRVVRKFTYYSSASAIFTSFIPARCADTKLCNPKKTGFI